MSTHSKTSLQCYRVVEPTSWRLCRGGVAHPTFSSCCPWAAQSISLPVQTLAFIPDKLKKRSDFLSVSTSPGRDRFLYAQNPHFRGQVWPFTTCQENNSEITQTKKEDALWDPWGWSIPTLWDLLLKVLHLVLGLEKVYLSSHNLGMLPDSFSAQPYVLQNALHFNSYPFPCLQQPFPSSSMAPVCWYHFEERSVSTAPSPCCALTHCHTQVMSSPKAQEDPSWPPVPCSAGHCIRKHECFLSSLLCCVSMSLSLNDHSHKTDWCLPMKNISGKGRRITVNLPAVLGGARSYLKWVYVPVVSKVGVGFLLWQ